eukprot:scaffold37967_cov57-Phaeocystis_antarctica.AAC.3
MVCAPCTSRFCSSSVSTRVRGNVRVSRVPYHGAVGDAHVFHALADLVDLDDALLELVLHAEDGRVVLHHLLHVAPDLGRRERARRVAQLVEVVNRELASVGRQRLARRGRRGDLVDPVGARTAEDDDVEQAVGQGQCVS